MKEEHSRYREEEKEEVNSDTSNENNSEDVNEPASSKENENIDQIKTELNKYRDLYLRTLAESENYKKRINDERIRDRKYACYSFAEKLISSLDIFDKVVSCKPEDEKLRNYLIGFEMINNQLKQIVADEGVKLIPSVGEKFNPQYHHAVETVWDETKDEDIIIEELQRGYMFKDRVLRAATVKVNKKPQENSKEEK